MPHGLFLGSHLATIDRLDIAPRPPPETSSADSSSLPSCLTRKLPRRFRDMLEKPSSWLDLKRLGRQQRPPHETPQSFTSGVELTEIGGDNKDIVPMISKEEAEATTYRNQLQQFDRISFARVHIAHATVSASVLPFGCSVLTTPPLLFSQFDTVCSLLGFAVTINSAILILAAAAFYYGSSAAVREAAGSADLFSAHELISSQIGKCEGFG
jgi:metal iron transporter